MSRVVELLSSRRAPQVAVLALISIGFAGCSADTSTRLQSFSSPFASDATGSVPPQPVPSGQIERRELPQYQRPPYSGQYSGGNYSNGGYTRPEYQQPQPTYQSSSLPPPISPPRSYPSSAGYAGGGRGVASYTPPPPPRIEETGSVAPRSVAANHPHPRGTRIIVGTSDTLEVLARRYHVSTAEILRANGFKGPRRLQPGQQLIIPAHGAVAAAAAAAAAPAAPRMAAAPVAATQANVHVVNHGDTLAGIARHNHVTVAELARANHIEATAPLKIGMRIAIPVRTASAAAPAPVAAAPVAAAPVAAAPVATVQKAHLAVATTPEVAAPKSPVKSAEATGALPSFRWPARGRVIAAYGAKTNGKQNDGINIAVPEGTPVKAAEDGVVAYAGNELKGYGNLVLIRHPSGYVTAYAHASELLVKRGEAIKRGQIIAKSGQTGEVSSPQLHFEIRKGATPVDPLQFLNGA